MITTTTIVLLIVLIVAIVLLFKYVIPTLPDPFNWIASLIVAIVLILFIVQLLTGHGFVLG